MTGTKRPPGSFCWSELATTDAAATKAFYTRLFGWKIDEHDMGHMGVYTKYKLGKNELGAQYEMNDPMFEGVPPHWLNYVLVDDVDRTMGRATSLGAQPVMGPLDVGTHGRMAVLSDPTGAVFALWQAKDHEGTPPLAPAHGVPCWYELCTRDAGRAGEFYAELFGWDTKVSAMPGGAGGKYTEFQVDGASIAGMLQMTEEFGDAPPHWMTYFHVDDCARGVERIAELGGAVCHGPMEVPGVGTMAVASDPSGAVFSIITLADAQRG